MAQSNNTYLLTFSCTTNTCLNCPTVKTNDVNLNARRRCYVNPVLQPIENLDQWKLAKEVKRDDIILAGKDVKKSNVRDRRYNNPVLKSIENSEQWKLAKEDKRNVTMLAGKDVKKSNARDRRYNNLVLRPVESLAQWNLVKVKRVTFDVRRISRDET